MIVLVVTALRPTLVTIVKLVSDIQKQKIVNAKLDSKLKQIQQAQEAYADKRVTSRMTLLDQSLPMEPKFASLGQGLLGMAAENSLTVKLLKMGEVKLKPGEPVQVEGGEMSRFEINMNVEGEYANTKRFVQRLENYRRVLDVKKITMRKQANESDLLQTDITIVAGYSYEK
jgi:Tfp pilus assembly protein PilO